MSRPSAQSTSTVEFVHVVHYQQQLGVFASEKCRGSTAAAHGPPDIGGDVDQSSECAERHEPLRRCARHPADDGREALFGGPLSGANRVLPTPSDPTSTTPERCGLSRAAATRCSTASSGAATHCTAGFYGGLGGDRTKCARRHAWSTFRYVPPNTDKWAICVYCASGPTHPGLLALAAQLGEAIAERGWTLVWGGGNVSAMGALARAARARGGRTVGVIPKMLMHREVADHDADELIVTDTMRERKQVMEDRADAFIALPGGLGTLEELFEVWTAGYLGLHDKPVVLLDPGGHYDGLRAWLYGLIDTGYVSEAALDRLVVADEVSAALAACAPG